MAKRSKVLHFHLVAAFTSLMLVCPGNGIGQSPTSSNSNVTEAPTGFDNLTNDFVDQPIHDEDRAEFFEEVDTVSSGLGPVFNDTSCVNCHSTPVDGGSSTTLETRAGHTSKGQFVNPTVRLIGGTISGRSLINSKAICIQAQERIPTTETIVAQRGSVGILGDGFVEAIPDQTLLAIAQRQPAQSNNRIHGLALQVPVLESPGVTRVGRFGWKDQHASLLSFAGDAYINEQGITNRLFPVDITSVCDAATDPEDPVDPNDGLADIDHLARFVRATKAPPVDANLASQPDTQAGSKLFVQIGCSICHVRALVTAPPGTVINGNFTIPDALGNKIIHPFSDFLLHDVGTGDGIVQNGPQSTANRLRTVPLWGVRLRASHLMHDGATDSFGSAILRHGGEAGGVVGRYQRLSPREQRQLQQFLRSL